MPNGTCAGAGTAATRRLVLGSLIATLGARAVRAQDASPGYSDLMPAFFAVYDGARSGPTLGRARGILEGFFTRHVEVYRAAGLGRVDLVPWLDAFDPLEPDVRRLAGAFPERWRDAVARFRAALPAFSTDFPMTVLPSFLQFDAKTRYASGRVHLFVGLDGVVWMHGPSGNLPVLIAHECFHLYQHQVNPSLLFPAGDPLWLGVWMEGLAVLASRVVNPRASTLEVLLTDPALVEVTPDVVRRVAAELAPVLDRTEGSVRSRYLSFGYRGDIPARSAYVVGLAIAERAARTRSLDDLARLPAFEARALVLAELQVLAAR